LVLEHLLTEWFVNLAVGCVLCTPNTSARQAQFSGLRSDRRSLAVRDSWPPPKSVMNVDAKSAREAGGRIKPTGASRGIGSNARPAPASRGERPKRAAAMLGSAKRSLGSGTHSTPPLLTAHGHLPPWASSFRPLRGLRQGWRRDHRRHEFSHGQRCAGSSCVLSPRNPVPEMGKGV